MEEQVQTQQTVETGVVQEPDFTEFVQQYPHVDAKSIPQQVWEEVKNGKPLIHAYEGHELRQLKSDNRRLQQQLHTLGRQAQVQFQSLGSMRSTGKSAQTDGFLMGFNQA